MSTALAIFVGCAIAGVLRVVAYRKGWIRTPEQVAKDTQEEKEVLLAYKEWRKDAGPEASADLSRRLASRRSSRSSGKKIV